MGILFEKLHFKKTESAKEKMPSSYSTRSLITGKMTIAI